MSKKSTKTKAPKATKAGGKPKSKKASPAVNDAPPQAAAEVPAEAAAEGTPETQTQATGFQIKKDAKGRFWVVAKDSGAEHGPYDTKQLATDAKAALASGATPAPAGEKPAKAKKVKEPKAKRVSAIDAAAQVLAASSEPMNCLALVEAMATQGLWESPGGKTPSATLYSAIIREIATKGKDSRFVKKDRGMFAANA
jgi:hypothetical protein